MALIALQAGELAFNGYKFARAFFLSGIQHDTVIETQDLPFVRGQYDPPGKPGPKIFTVSGFLGGGGAILDSAGNQILTADELQAELDILRPNLFAGRKQFQWRFDTNANRWAWAQMTRPRHDYISGNGYRVAVMSLDFMASDPLEYSYTPKSVAVQSGAAGGAVSGNCVNAGNFRSYPIVTLTFQSTCVNPRVVFAPPAGGSIGFTLTGSFTTGDTVIVYCDPLPSSGNLRGVTKNAVYTNSLISLPITNTVPAQNGIPNTEFFPFVDAGTNVATVSATSGQFTATIAFNDSWI